MEREDLGPRTILRPDDTYLEYAARRRRYKDRLIDKWMWLIEGTKKQDLTPIQPQHWGTMAMLFENQKIENLRMEATKTTDVALPVVYGLPIIRKVYPNLVAMKVCSVQPMPAESGGVMNVFYQDFQREDAGASSLVTPDSDYGQSEENAVPKRVKMVVTKQTVEADKKILGASWSTEIEEDARGALNIDVESELINQMALEIQREIDQIILAEMLLWAAAGNTNWSWTNPQPAAYTAKDWYETLGHAFVDMEDNVYGQRYHRADWIVAGRNVVKYIRKMQDFKPKPRNQPYDPFKMGVELIGTVEGYWDVYLTVHINTNRAIMGYYPNGLQTAYVFAPYIPLQPMPKIYAEFKAYDDATMPGAYVNVDKWSRNVRTRYAKKLVVPEALATLSISA